ncbi:MAG: protein-L-isoaspartate(D-aspartate) O-methyltransferase [Candidatus Omnitrophica bacterium]|nr:protein-L-isoaspartate(D-aspartate) O-methyltransferase [Candidatus Omnitrophota bacterium]
MDFALLKERMLNEQLIRRGIEDVRVLEAFRKINRHEFVPAILKKQSYADWPLAIGEGQTISQPYIVAYMIETLNLKGGERVLEIGTGSGYQTALLSNLAKEVYSIERSRVLAKRAQEALQRLEIANNKVIVGDGTKGLAEFSPFDAIIVSAAAPQIPAPLTRQLAQEGRMIIPIGERFSQVLIRLTKIKDNIKEERLVSCVFVPLVGEFGWGEKVNHE